MKQVLEHNELVLERMKSVLVQHSLGLVANSLKVELVLGNELVLVLEVEANSLKLEVHSLVPVPEEQEQDSHTVHLARLLQRIQQ